MIIRLQKISILLLIAIPNAEALAERNVSFCADLDRTITAVERREIALLDDANFRSPNFGFSNNCSAQGTGWFCQQSLGPKELSAQSLKTQILQCSPQFITWHQDAAGYEVLEGGTVRLRIQESGAPGAQVGRIVTLVVEPGVSQGDAPDTHDVR